jgi:single-stranded DNA-binding protein
MKENETFQNDVTLAGYLAKDPDIRRTTTGKNVANLIVLTKYKEAQQYHKVTLWSPLSETAAALRKGDFVKILGHLQNSSWEDPNTHAKRYSTAVVCWQLTAPNKETETGGKAAARAILQPAKSIGIPIEEHENDF